MYKGRVLRKRGDLSINMEVWPVLYAHSLPIPFSPTPFPLQPYSQTMCIDTSAHLEVHYLNSHWPSHWQRKNKYLVSVHWPLGTHNRVGSTCIHIQWKSTLAGNRAYGRRNNLSRRCPSSWHHVSIPWFVYLLCRTPPELLLPKICEVLEWRWSRLVMLWF